MQRALHTVAAVTAVVVVTAGTALAQVEPGDFTVTYNANATSCQVGDQDYAANGSFTVTVGTETGACADPAATLYTVSASPVPGSGPGGTTPPTTSIAAFIGFSSGNFVFSSAGAGDYTVTVTMTASSVCAPPTNPKQITATVPQAATSCDAPPEGDFTVTYNANAPSCQVGDQDYAANGSFTVTVGTETGACADPAATVYTVTATPVFGSGPDLTSPPPTTIPSHIGLPSGDFLFSGAGAGEYTVTVTMTASTVCAPPTNPKQVTATVPQAAATCDPPPIPALGTAGLAALALVLAALGLVAVRRL